MAKGRELKGRIKSVENTRKITRTMEMVATSKMKRAQDRVVAARPFANSLTEVIANLYTPELAEAFPLLRQPATIKQGAVIVLTSNRGLAGAFNANLIKEARALLARLEERTSSPSCTSSARRDSATSGTSVARSHRSRTDITDKPTAENAAELVDALIQRFASGEIDARLRRLREISIGAFDAADDADDSSGHSSGAHADRSPTTSFCRRPK